MKQLLYFLSAATLFVTGCSKELPGDTLQGQQEIQFRTFIEEGGEIRPLDNTETRSFSGDPLSNGYLLTTLLTSVDYPTASGTYERMMESVPMSKDGSFKETADHDKYFWTEGGASLRHTFVAYSAVPKGASGTLGTLGGGTSSNPIPYLSYTHAADPSQQMDLLYSDNAKNITINAGGNAPVVNLVFKHLLSRVIFKLIGTGRVPLVECQAKITYKSNTVYSAGLLFLDQNTSVSFSSSPRYPTSTYNLGAPFSLPGSSTTPETAVEMGDMILIPQSLIAGWVTLTLNYKLDGATVFKTISVDLPALDLTGKKGQGQQYEILLHVVEESQNLSVASVTLSDWKNKSGTIERF